MKRMPVLTISRDEMEAYIDPGQCRTKVSLDDLTQLINKTGIRYGLDKTRLRDLAMNGFIDNQPVLIAKGRAPIAGKDAEVLLCFRKKQSDTTPASSDDESGYDYFDKNKIVKKNEILAVKLKPEHGIPGTNVFGDTIAPRPGKNFDFEPGKNVQIRFFPDKIEYSAMCEGIVRLHHSSIEVSSLAVIRQNIDLTTGDIEFAGNLLIKGDVCKGFSVRSQGNITIEGSVSGGAVITTGSIEVLGNVNDSSILQSGGYIQASRIEHSRAEAMDDIIIKDSILYSTIVCNGMVSIIQGRGVLVGGTIQVGSGLRAKSIGAQSAVSTKICLGKHDLSRKRFYQMEKELQTVDSDIIEIQKIIKPLISKSKDSLTVPFNKRWAIQSLANRLKTLKNRRDTLKMKLSEINSACTEPGQLKLKSIPRIKVYKTLHRGVTIASNSKAMTTNNELYQVEIFKSPHNGNIVVTKLSDIQEVS